MGKDNKTKTVFLWYTAVVCLCICLYGAVFLSPVRLVPHNYRFGPHCYYMAIGVICAVLIPSVFKGSRQQRDICRFALSSVICLALVPVFLRAAMLLDDGLNEYVISGFLFRSLPVFIFVSLVLAVISIFRIVFRKANLAGVWFSAAVIGVVAFEIFVPEFIKFYDRSHPHPGLICQSNLRWIHTAMIIYAHDYDGNKLPTGDKWCNLLMQEADVSEKAFRCPFAKEGLSHYAINKDAFKMGLSSPGEVVLLFETRGGWNMVGGREDLTTERHEGMGCYVVFCDGRVRFVKTAEIGNLKWEVYDKE